MKNYIKSKRNVTGLLVVCSVIHVVVLLVYGYDAEPVLYATGLYALLVLLVGMLDFLFQRKRWNILHTYDVSADRSLQELITPREPVEKEYLRLIECLQNSVKEQTNDYLKMEKEKQDFYTMWVHQIKTPIAAQKVLLQTNPDNISGMKGELFKIERYVDIILNYLRMDNIHQDLLFKHYSLESMVRQAVKKYSTLFIQSRLSLQLEELEPFVLTDEKWLVFVIEQLLSNAIKYTRRGGIRIYSQSVQEEDKKTTKLFMEDTGIGIHGEDLPRLFDRAFTGYNGRRDKKASGLGLYLCKRVLEKLGHDIAITSTPGKGTCVVVTFHEERSFCGNLTKM